MNSSHINILFCFFAGEEMVIEKGGTSCLLSPSQDCCLRSGFQILQFFQLQDCLRCSQSSRLETGCGMGSWGSVSSNCCYTIEWMRKLGLMFVTSVSFYLLYVQWWLVSRCLRDCQTWHLCLSAERLVVSENRCGLVEQSIATTFFKTLLWLWRLLTTFQMSLSLPQGLFVKVAGNLLSYLFFSSLF